MQTTNFIFYIEAEQNNSVLVKILTAILRRRNHLLSFCSHYGQEDVLQVVFTINESPCSAQIFQTVDKQVDIISITFFDQQIEPLCKTDHQKNSLTL